MEIKTDALYKVGTEPITGQFYRYVRTRYSNEPLSVFGAMTNGGRYNVAGLFGVLYLGFDTKTCEAEVNNGIAAGLPFKPGAFTAWNYDVSLKNAVRLRVPWDRGWMERHIEFRAPGSPGAD
jgi:RES domain-containing protein